MSDREYDYIMTGTLDDFAKDVSMGTRADTDERIEAQRSDPFYDRAKVTNHVANMSDVRPQEVVEQLKYAKTIGDVITGIAMLTSLIGDMDEQVRTQGDYIDYLETQLQTLKIEKQGPQGKDGLVGARGPQGPPGEPAPDLHDEVIAQVTEVQEVFKDLQEQIDDLAEEL